MASNRKTLHFHGGSRFKSYKRNNDIGHAQTICVNFAPQLQYTGLVSQN
jgi:hypothetical protein